MLVALFIALTLLAIWVLTAAYCLSMALIARAAGITIERCAIGIGPTICQLEIHGIPIVLKPIPFSCYAKLKGFGEGDRDNALLTTDGLVPDDADPNSHSVRFENEINDSHRDSLSPDSFHAAPYPLRAAILLGGPLTNILLGLLLLGLPVWTKAEKHLSRFGEGELIEPSGVPDLRLEHSPPSEATQLQVVQQTAGYYVTQMISFRSLEGWGGYIACVATSAVVANQSLWGWLTCVGVIALANGVVNLLPVPILNGGRLILETYSAVFGRIREAAFVLLSYLGLALVLVVMGRIVWLDVTWLIGLF